MEKAWNFGINGGLNLPVGYRFKPTDEELVVHYLKRKVLSLPLPASIIPEFDVSQIDPFALPGDANEKRYFFYKKKKSESGIEIVGLNKRYNSCGSSGYWKPVGKGRLIVASSDQSKSNQAVVGLRRTLAFCDKKRFRDTNTRWLLHEYHLVRSGPTPNSLHLISPMGTDEYWVVCGLFQKKRRPNKKSKTTKKRVIKKNTTNDNETCAVSNSGPTTPTMSCSSGITDNNDHDHDANQELSSVISVSFCNDNSCIREPWSFL